MGPHVTWIEEKMAEGAGEPGMGAGGTQLRVGILEAA